MNIVNIPLRWFLKSFTLATFFRGLEAHVQELLELDNGEILLLEHACTKPRKSTKSEASINK